MENLEGYIDGLVSGAESASRELAATTPGVKNQALDAMAGALEAGLDPLLEENAKDLKAASEAELSTAMVDRLRLDKDRVSTMADAIRDVAQLADPVGEVIEGYTRPNGVRIERVRVPLGVIAMIYESRPNVTSDVASLTLKSGNAVILRGGKEARYTNAAILRPLKEGIRAAGLPATAVNLVETTDRAAVGLLLGMTGRIDLVIPRGGKALIRRVVEEARVPVIKHYEGICHTYVDSGADLAVAEKIALNAKVQRPGVCNAMETLLVHEDVAAEFLPMIAASMREAGVVLKGDDAARAVVPEMEPATAEDWATEYLDLILSVRVVASLDEAIDHVNSYGSKHSDAIVTESYERSERFIHEVDSAAVFVNASVRLHDGGQFGMGAEIGISTDKLHARGPMGLRELTTYKFVVRGDGQIRE